MTDSYDRPVTETKTFSTAKELRDFLNAWTDGELETIYTDNGLNRVSIFPRQLSDGSYVLDMLVKKQEVFG